MKPHLESFFIETTNFVIGNIYRPSNSNLDNFLYDMGLLLEILATKIDNLVLLHRGF